jgi:hypothetical protein
MFPLHKHRLKLHMLAEGLAVSSPTVHLSSVIFHWGSIVTFAIQVAASRISEASFLSHFPAIVEQTGLPGTIATLLP